MQALRELITELKYRYDNSGLKAYISDVKGAVNQIKQNITASSAAVTAPIKANTAQIAEAKNGLLSLRNLAMGYIGVLAGGTLVQVADEWNAVSGRIKLATHSAEEHQYALDNIYAIAQRTNQEYTATGDLFQKVQRNAGSLGLGLDDSLNLTEIIGQTMAIGGGDAASQQAALMQLGQALGSGALRGDELNSIMEQAPRLAQAIADSFGVGVGQLKDMGKAGELTSKELAQGLLKQAGKIQAEFTRLPHTFGQGMTKLKNTFGRVISYAVNQVGNLGEAFYQMADWVERNITLVLILAASAIGGKLVLALKAVNGQLRLMMGHAWKAMLPFLKIAAILAVIFLIAEDLYGWTQGWESATGGLVGRYDEWAHQFKAIKQNALLLWASIKGLFDDVSRLIGVDISDWLPDFSSWGAFASGALQWIINGVNNLINVLRKIVSVVRAVFQGDFSGALSHAGEGVNALSMKFLPFYAIVFGVVKKIGGVISWLIGSPFKHLGKAFYGIGYAIGKLVKVAGFILKPLFAVGKAFLWVGRMIAIAFASNPIGLLITAVIAAVMLIIAYWDDIKIAAGIAWDWICTKCTEVWNSIKATAEAVWNGLSNTITAVWNGIQATAEAVWNAILAVHTAIWDGIKAVANAVWKAITDDIQAKADFVGKLWDNITSLFQTAWNGAINVVKNAFSSLIPDWVKNMFGGGANVTVNGKVEQVASYPTTSDIGAVKGSTYTVTQNNTQHITVSGVKNPESSATALSAKAAIAITKPTSGFIRPAEAG